MGDARDGWQVESDARLVDQRSLLPPDLPTVPSHDFVMDVSNI
jgi:hypothetical protein